MNEKQQANWNKHIDEAFAPHLIQAQGAQARLEGKPILFNPYNTLQPEHARWDHGWRNADRDLRLGDPSEDKQMSNHTWKVGDYAKPKRSVYDTKYRIVEIKDHYMVAEIVKSPTCTRIHIDPANVAPCEY